jgi:holo-ACP synthase CitX
LTDLTKIRLAILDAKELRWKKQLAFIDQLQSTILSFKFNIPSWPKNSSLIDQAWTKSFEDFTSFLLSKKISFDILEKNNTVLGPESFIKIDMLAKEVKKITVEFEENYQFGRLLDLDVIGLNKKPIERDVKRKCYLCNDLAINCMHENRHSPEEAREVFNKILKENI